MIISADDREKSSGLIELLTKEGLDVNVRRLSVAITSSTMKYPLSERLEEIFLYP